MNELELKAVEAADRAALALKTPDRLSSADAGSLMQSVGTPFIEVEARMVAIQPRSPTRPPGRAREVAATTGTPAELIEMDAEHARLVVLADRLQAQRDALARIRQTARGREAIANLPGLMKKLDATVSEAEAALKALADARTKARRMTDEIASARHLGSMHGGKLPKPDSALIARLFACDPDAYAKNSEMFAERLGLSNKEGLQ